MVTILSSKLMSSFTPEEEEQIRRENEWAEECVVHISLTPWFADIDQPIEIVVALQALLQHVCSAHRFIRFVFALFIPIVCIKPAFYDSPPLGSTRRLAAFSRVFGSLRLPRAATQVFCNRDTYTNVSHTHDMHVFYG
jgi:hypothetical protein